jgi:hypothetical protein
VRAGVLSEPPLLLEGCAEGAGIFLITPSRMEGEWYAPFMAFLVPPPPCRKGGGQQEATEACAVPLGASVWPFRAEDREIELFFFRKKCWKIAIFGNFFLFFFCCKFAILAISRTSWGPV